MENFDWQVPGVKYADLGAGIEVHSHLSSRSKYPAFCFQSPSLNGNHATDAFTVYMS